MSRGVISPARKARAIRWAIQHRKIHKQWVRWCRKYPRASRGNAGGVRHHERAIARYDEIIRVMRAAPTRARRATRRA
jgi:hypothetical protein